MSNYVRKKSQAQEKRTAKEFGGRTQAGSGSVWSGKGDVRTPEFLIENKFTDEEFYKLELKIWDKIEREATKDGLRIPLLQIDIQDKSYVIMNIWDARELYGEHKVDMVAVNTINKSYRLYNTDIEYLLSPCDSMHVVNFANKSLAILSLDKYKFLLDNFGH